MNFGNVNTVSSYFAKTNTTNGKTRQQNMMANPAYAEREQARSEKINNMRSLIRDADKKQQQNKPKSIVESTLSYGQQIRASRTNTKSTANEMKKLKYNFKNISSQIRRSKTSVSAKQVASKARREVVQLKAKLQTGKYDEDELTAAIEHAKSMERAAKKKARHLEEEELIKITDKAAGAGLTEAELEEKLENKADEIMEQYDAEMEAERQEEIEALSEEQIAEMEQAIKESMEEVQQMMEESMESSMEEVTEDMYDLISEAMEDMMEETLENLMDGMMVVTDFEMTEDEFKSYKLKHRTSEDKAMLEADAKYLKAIFDSYSKKMGADGGTNMGSPVASSSPVGVDMSSNIPNIVDVSV